MASDKAEVKGESADSDTNEVGPELMENTYRVKSKTGLTLGHLDDTLEEGDEVVLKEDVARLLLRQGVIEPV